MIHDLNQHYTIEVVGERQFHIHRFMLKKLFNHMAGLLESDGDQTSQFVISNVVSADIFQPLHRYMYGHTIFDDITKPQS